MNLQDESGLRSLVSKVSGGVAGDIAFRVGQYLDLFFFKMLCSNLLIYCIILGREISWISFFF